MAVRTKLCSYLRSRKGSSAVEFIATAAMLILTFAVLISALIYVTTYYNASYICRRVVRTIEVTGEYDAAEIDALADGLGGSAMDDLTIRVDAHYFRQHCIQLRDEFRVTLTANYTIRILQFGGRPIEVRLPINVGLSGRSEVYWK
jgi:Flp pilus assembly protein TadG